MPYLIVSIFMPVLNDVSRITGASLSMHAAVLEEKSAALHALGSYAEHVSGPFTPFIEQSLRLVLQMCQYFHDSIREEAYTVLGNLLAATRAAFPSSTSGTNTFEPMQPREMFGFLAQSRTMGEGWFFLTPEELVSRRRCAYRMELKQDELTGDNDADSYSKLPKS